jgi:hypothetical protein
MLRYLLASLALAAGSAHAANYVKVQGENVDFYYDSDFWDLGATVSGSAINVRTGSVGRREEVTEGAADPYLGPVYTKELSFTQPYSQSVIAVAHAGYTLTNNINAAATVSMTADGFAGAASYSLEHFYTSGSYSNGAFVTGEALGNNGEYAYFQYDGWGSSSAGDEHLPLEVTTTLSSHQAIAASGSFYGYAFVTALGVADVTLNGVNYNFTVSAVPEPAQYLLLGAGLALLGCVTRRRRRGMP